MIKKYRVYFDQINADVVEVQASNPQAAIRRATKMYLQDNQPTIAYDGVEVVD